VGKLPGEVALQRARQTIRRRARIPVPVGTVTHACCAPFFHCSRPVDFSTLDTLTPTGVAGILWGMTVAGVVASADAQVAAERLLTRLGPRVGQRFALLLSSGVGVEELERETDTLVAAMEQMLPAPSVPAQVSGPVWTTEQVRVALGRPGGVPVSRQAVDDRVRRGTLLALRVAEHGERAYPLWQFAHHHDRWEVLPGLAALLRAVPETVTDRWTLASWLRQPHPALDGHTPLDHLIEHGHADEHLLEVARATAARWAA